MRSLFLLAFIVFSLPAAALEVKPEWVACIQDDDCKVVSQHCGYSLGVNREYAREAVKAIETEIMESSEKCTSYGRLAKSALCKNGTCQPDYRK